MFGNPFAGAAGRCTDVYNQIPSRNDISEACLPPICTAWDTVKWGANAAAVYANTWMQAMVEPPVTWYRQLSSATMQEIIRLILVSGDSMLTLKSMGKMYFDSICANANLVNVITFGFVDCASKDDADSDGDVDSNKSAVIFAGFLGLLLAIGLTAFADDIFRRKLRVRGHEVSECVLQKGVFQRENWLTFRGVSLVMLGLTAVVSMDNIAIDLGSRVLSSGAVIAARVVSFILSFSVAVYARKAFNDSGDNHKLPPPTSCLHNEYTATFMGWAYAVVSAAPFFITNAYGKSASELAWYAFLSAFVLIRDEERFVPPIKNHMRLLSSHVITQEPIEEVASWVGSLATIILSLISSFRVTNMLASGSPKDIVLYGEFLLEIAGEIFLQLAGGFPQPLEPAAQAEIELEVLATNNRDPEANRREDNREEDGTSASSFQNGLTLLPPPSSLRGSEEDGNVDEIKVNESESGSETREEETPSSTLENNSGDEEQPGEGDQFIINGS